MRRLLVVMVIACLGALALPATAGAGGSGLELSLASPTEPLSFTATIVGFDCNPNSFVLVSLTLNGAPVEPLSVTEDPADPNTVTIVLPSDSPPGALLAIAGCTDGEVTIPPQTGAESFAALAVTKAVEGTPPVDATFTVNVDCVGGGITATSFDGVSAAELPQDFDADLVYDATGGLAYVYSDHSVSCTVTEPETGGATSVAIDPGTVEITAPEAYEATVTNTFVEPIVVAPTFTG